MSELAHQEKKNKNNTKVLVNKLPEVVRETTVTPPILSQSLQRTIAQPEAVTNIDGANLQRSLGNRATGLLIQSKLAVGPAGDKYEQEADSVARQVVQHISANKQPYAHRQEEEEALQMKPLVQRQEEEELQMKPLPSISTLQRQEAQEEEEELQMKPAATLQRQEEEEELQMKPASSLQRQEEEELQMQPAVVGVEGGQVAVDVEQSIQAARGSGQPLDAQLREPMEQAFGADFSGVRVHTSGHSDELNRSIQARAFTTGQDIFFRSGEYQPDSQAGQELLAHELTHTIQQGGTAVIQRKMPTLNKWKKDSSLFFFKRSSELKEIDAAVQHWHEVKDDEDLDVRSRALFAIKVKVLQWAQTKISAKTGKAESKRKGSVQQLLLQVDEENAKLVIVKRIKETYGVTLKQSAGLEAIKGSYANAPESVRKGLQVKDWTLEELQDVETALSRYGALLGPNRPEQFGDQPLTTFSRLAQGIDEDSPEGELDDTTAGETFTGAKNVSMFDAGTTVTDFVADKNKPTAQEYRKGFRGTIEHELSHALIENLKVGGAKKIIRQFVSAVSFWSGINVPAHGGNTNGQKISNAQLAGTEIPPTKYGATDAYEDLAESLMFYFEDPATLQTKCPEHYNFIKDVIEPILNPPENGQEEEDLDLGGLFD